MKCPACEKAAGDADRVCAGCGEPLPVRPGRVIGGRYEILAQLGEGGMGTVFRARDHKLRVHVALKVLRVGADAGAVRRFHHEVTLARRVRHENVCGVYEYGEDEGLVYCTMDLLTGRNLRQLLRERGLLPVDRAWDLALKAARGLQAIHAAGVLHRDLKTSNIMIGARDQVWLVDFGIARPLPAPVDDESPTTPSADTDRLAVVGTPEYMSPEQVQGWPLDERSDIYSFGIVLFELFTGRVPFQGSSRAATMRKHLSDPPPLHGAEALSLPEALVPVLGRALAKDPDRRHASVGELIGELEKAASFRTQTFSTARRASWRALAPLLLLVGSGLVLALLVRLDSSSTSPSSTLASPVSSTTMTATTTPMPTVFAMPPLPVSPAPPTLRSSRSPRHPDVTGKIPATAAPPASPTPTADAPTAAHPDPVVLPDPVATPTPTPVSTPSPYAAPAPAPLPSTVEQPPQCLSCPNPPYPPALERMGVQGEVELEITVDERGQVMNARVVAVNGDTEFGRAAQKAVRNWRFKPATRDGVPVRATLRQPVLFRLRP
jgi:TonB family protein